MKKRRAAYGNNSPVAFSVDGDPRPKQSFKMGNGHGYQPARVTAWQVLIRAEASSAMDGRQPLAGPLSVSLDFYLPDRRRRDLDNLSKAVLDACNGVVWGDDQQVTELHITKNFDRGETGVTVYVEPQS